MKRIILILLTAVLVALFIIPSSAKSVLNYGGWVVTFTESEELAFTVDSCDLADEELVVPSSFDGVKVNGIGGHAFANNRTARAITLNSYIGSIGEYAFINCTALESIELNYALRSIETGAFSGTSSLKSIDLENSVVTEIAPYTFLNSGIEEVTLPETCTKLDMYSFGQCFSLNKITIPDNVTEIADTAFAGCESLVIYCTTDSYAHEYAEAKGIPYVLTDAPVEHTFTVGDTDGDGTVTIIDATKIQRLLAGLVDDPDGMMALRAAGGAELNIMHATRIQRWLAGYSVEGGVGETVTV